LPPKGSVPHLHIYLLLAGRIPREEYHRIRHAVSHHVWFIYILDIFVLDRLVGINHTGYMQRASWDGPVNLLSGCLPKRPKAGGCRCIPPLGSCVYKKHLGCHESLPTLSIGPPCIVARIPKANACPRRSSCLQKAPGLHSESLMGWSCKPPLGLLAQKAEGRRLPLYPSSRVLCIQKAPRLP
jgi:hypothetical protein